jgi:hypothetical protein
LLVEESFRHGRRDDVVMPEHCFDGDAWILHHFAAFDRLELGRRHAALCQHLARERCTNNRRTGLFRDSSGVGHVIKVCVADENGVRVLDISWRDADRMHTRAAIVVRVEEKHVAAIGDFVIRPTQPSYDDGVLILRCRATG